MLNSVPAEASWRKSSLSAYNDNNCVEVAPCAAVVAVRDTKDREGGTLAIPASAWDAFVGAAKGAAFRDS